MNLPCDERQTAGSMPNCPCDEFVHPRPLAIPAGLTTIPRQVATFPEFRRAMLRDIPKYPALADWRARAEGDDFGLMLLEMWAYVSDVLAFYDEAIAHEAYLRTARLRPSLRKLVGLLGYVPRPAVGARVSLAAFAEGRQPLTLPRGTAFRSGAFDGQPPQVFELDTATTIDPLFNRWKLDTNRPPMLGRANPASLLVRPAAALLTGSALLVRVADGSAPDQVRLIAGIRAEPIEGAADARRLTFASTLSLPADIPLAALTLETPTRRAGLWTVSNAQPAVETIGGGLRLILESQHRDLHVGDRVLVSDTNDYLSYTITQVDEVLRQPGPGASIEINGSTFNLPVVTVPVTRLWLDVSLAEAIGSSPRDTGVLPISARRAAAPAAERRRRAPSSGGQFTDSQRTQLTVHYGLVSAGTPLTAPDPYLRATDPLSVAGPLEAPLNDRGPASLLLEDKNHRGVAAGGDLNFSTGELTLGQETSWQPPLLQPVELYGNVLSASRGETVVGEILGNGDASTPNQSFKLKKKPLTYLTATTSAAAGPVSTLQIRVGGVSWGEVPSFFGVGPDAQVFIVRENDDGEAVVTFGDGRRGARLPSGQANVVANYRHGAGAAAPPAGSITQLARPARGLRAIRNPVPATGGADAEAVGALRTYAPRSALLLGRAVSIQDMEAAAAGVPGVRAVRCEWRWNAVRQRPSVQVWYVGPVDLRTTVSGALRLLSDPTTAIDVTQALGLPMHLTLEVEVDPRYRAGNVSAAVRAGLLDRDAGLLAPERIGIGLPIFRSRLFEAVLATPGCLAVRSILWNGLPWLDFALQPGAGRFFDLEAGELVVNGV